MKLSLRQLMYGLGHTFRHGHLWAFAVAIAAACLPAIADDTTGDDPGTTTPVENFSPDSDYYSNITYEWVDEDGVHHTSNLGETATEYNQIVAMLREVYTNSRVPGFVEDRAWNDNYYKDHWDEINPSNEYTAYENNAFKVKYSPCLAPGNPYFSAEEISDWLDETVLKENKKIKISDPIEGATAMMVELVDDYEFNRQDSPEQMLRKIKRLSIMTSQRYIRGTSSGNPGYLFNYVGALNRFYVISKGNNRIANNSDEVGGELQGHAPFYHMFEEFSPTNSGPHYNAYAGMRDGMESYGVDHNCTSVSGQDHIMIMSPQPTEANPNTMRDYAVNFMFFLPDLRFANDSRVKGFGAKGDNGEGQGQAGEYYGWYTYYDENHQPYFFLSYLNATIDDMPVLGYLLDSQGEKEVANENKATVKLRWQSTYNNVVGYQALEDFYIYRVVDDVEEPNPLVPGKDFVMNGKRANFPDYHLPEFKDDYVYYTEEDDNVDSENYSPYKNVGCVTTGNQFNVAYVYEDWKRISHDVYYIVKSRRTETDFELVSSDIVDATIPGKEVGERDLNIVIDGERNSVHNITACTNDYDFTIKVVDRTYNTSNPDTPLTEATGYNDCNLTRAQFDAPIVMQAKRNNAGQKIGPDNKPFMTNNVYDANHEPVLVDISFDEDGKTRLVQRGTRLVLKRYINPTEEQQDAPKPEGYDIVATLEVTKIIEDKWNQWEYTCKLIYPDGTEEAEQVCFKSSVFGSDGDDKYFGLSNPVLALQDNKRSLYNFVDRIRDVDTREGLHPDKYMYTVDYEDCIYTDPNAGSANWNPYSNKVKFAIPKNELNVGFIPYSEEDILNDAQYGNLKPNTPGVQLTLTSNPNVRDYAIYQITNNTGVSAASESGSVALKPVVRVTRMPSGRLYLERQDRRGQLNYVESRYQSEGATPDVATPYGAKDGETYSLVVTYNNGNSYGNKVVDMLPRPRPEIQVELLKALPEEENPSTYVYGAKIEWHGLYNATEDKNQEFGHRGYRVWHKHNGEADMPYTAIHSWNDSELQPAPGEEETPELDNSGMTKAVNAESPTYGQSFQIFNAHKATEQNPVEHNATVRMYSVIPQSHMIGENLDPKDTGYIISDHEVRTTATNFDNITTGIGSIESDDSNAPVEYYTLQGLRIANPEPGMIVIRRQGSTTSKILVK